MWHGVTSPAYHTANPGPPQPADFICPPVSECQIPELCSKLFTWQLLGLNTVDPLWLKPVSSPFAAVSPGLNTVLAVVNVLDTNVTKSSQSSTLGGGEGKATQPVSITMTLLQTTK